MSYLASNMFSLTSIKVICVHHDLVIIRATPWAKYAYVFSMGKKKIIGGITYGVTYMHGKP